MKEWFHLNDVEVLQIYLIYLNSSLKEKQLFLVN